MPTAHDAERTRLAATTAGTELWHRWGPYLSERQWGTVREDYSAAGDAWSYLPFDAARSRAYRWGEDGILGFCDNRGLLNFALCLWNGADPILKERLFGLTNPQGNHGEDVKEYYYFLDNTPTHSYMKGLYKYPQRAFPYDELVTVNGQRGQDDPEYELLDTGIFAENRYFDVVVEYAKASTDDICIRISATNWGPDAAPLHLLPTLWFRNTWSWGRDDTRPALRTGDDAAGARTVVATDPVLGEYHLQCLGTPDLLFTENETNSERLWGSPNRTPYVKDGIDAAVVYGNAAAVNSAGAGTKVAAHYRLTIAPGATETVELRFTLAGTSPGESSDAVFAARIAEADAFYAAVAPAGAAEDARAVQRQALAGLLWSKQFYDYDVRIWLEGDPGEPPPPTARLQGRNHDWRHLDNDNVLLMPDTWEYPWYAAWDLGFHCVSMALVDPTLAKRQLVLLLREWYMHPNGQLPAYEWNFNDVNPPVHAWAALQVYRTEQRTTGSGDTDFLERVFVKLLLNFTWWVNREDREGRNIFQGGFLGLDNIGVFDRSAPLPTGGYLEQADGTAWMGMYCLNMLAIALELARKKTAYEDVATKFFEHFLGIAAALNTIGGPDGVSLWDEDDEFFYDVLRLPDDQSVPLKVRSLVGLLPLLAVETIEPETLQALPEFAARMDWYLAHRPDLADLVSHWNVPGEGELRLLALTRGHRTKALLRRMLDPAEFLSDHGIRSVSKYHLEHPYTWNVQGQAYTVQYVPGASDSRLFGGNSNWRGPVWFPTNYLLIEALHRFHRYYSDDFLVEYPTGSGQMCTLLQIAQSLSGRLISLFTPGAEGTRPVFGDVTVMQTDPAWRDHLLFHEYFHGDTGAGLGASHQTGWTAVVANLITDVGE